jgi:formin 2
MSLYYVATGQMLINWFLSAFPEEHYLRLLLTSQDLRILAAQFCTYLLAAGVLRQIPDKDVTLEPLFRVSKPLHIREVGCSSILFSDLLNGHVCEI